MSRRYGRNQRRHAREEQARLTAALEMQRGLAAHLAEEKRSAEAELREAREFAVPFSAAFAPEAWEVEGPRRLTLEIQERQHMGADLHFINEPAGAMAETMLCRRLPLQVLLAEVHDERFQQSLHCRVRFGDGTWGYGITKQALASMPRARLVQTIASAIAEQIARDVRQEAP